LQDLAGFKRRQVKVTGIHFLSEEDVLEASGLKIGSDMFGLDIPKAAQGVESLGWVEKVYLERRLPQSVLIAVTERKPAALVDSAGLWGLSSDGHLLPFSPELGAEDLPILSGARMGVEAVGTTRSAELFRPALEFLDFLKREDPTLYAGLSEVNVSERDQLKTTFLDGLQARFSPGAGETEMRRMAAVLSDLGSKGLRAESMDFRFKNQVVVKTR
jgi:cell division protein FtsQ